MARQILAEFNNDAGSLALGIYKQKGILLTLSFPESFSSDDSIQLNLENLRFIGNKPGEPGTIFEYICGKHGEKRIEIQLNENDVAGNFGVFSVKLTDFKVSRGSWDEGFEFFTQVNQALQTEAARQEALRAAARARGRNVAALQQTFAGRTGPNVLGGPGPRNLIASFLSGEAGNIATQVAATKKKAAVANARRRKTRRRRN